MYGIQYLETMTLMSRVQKLNESNSIENLYETVEWKKLTTEEKEAFSQAFLDKALTDSNASSTAESLRSSEHRDSGYFVRRMEEMKGT